MTDPFHVLSDDSQVWISMGDLARVLGWSTIRTKRWFRKNRAAVKRGGRWYTTRSLIRRAFPEEWEEVTSRLP